MFEFVCSVSGLARHLHSRSRPSLLLPCPCSSPARALFFALADINDDSRRHTLQRPARSRAALRAEGGNRGARARLDGGQGNTAPETCAQQLVASVSAVASANPSSSEPITVIEPRLC